MSMSANYDDAVALIMTTTGDSRSKAALIVRYAHEALAIPFGARIGPQNGLGTNPQYA